MKNLFLLTFVFLTTTQLTGIPMEKSQDESTHRTGVQSPAKDKALKGSLSLSGAWALYPIAVKWAEEFRKTYPDVRIDISAGGAGKGITDALSNMVEIGMVSREIYAQEKAIGAYAIAVVKDAVIPVINASNPALEAILKTGLTKEDGKNIWITGTYKTWNQITGTKGNVPVHVYTRSDACGAGEVWAKYFAKNQEDLLGSGVYGDPGLALAVRKDPIGIGYNNIGYAYDSKTKKQIEGIRVLPIDLNNDGKITPDEDFYGSLDTLIEAIAAGKFPSPPARDLFFVTKGKPTDEILVTFINWVLNEGQKYVKEAGYITLSKSAIASELEKIR